MPTGLIPPSISSEIGTSTIRKMSSREEPAQDLGSLIDNTIGNAAFVVVALKNVSELSGQYGLTFATAAQAEFQIRLRRLLRESDQLLPIGSDRVCLVFDELMDDNHVLLAGLKIERAFEEPFCEGDHSAQLVARAGLVYYGSRERLKDLGPEDLYRFAEVALGRAEEQEVCFEISSEEAFSQMQRDWQTNAELDQALRDHEITLDYQPKYRLEDGELAAEEVAEARVEGGVH